MSFHSTLTASGVWPTDLVSAGVVSATGKVSDGRQRPTVRSTGVQVWINRQASKSMGKGMHRITEHEYLLHVMGGKGTKSPTGGQVEEIEGHLETLVNRYSGALPFVATMANIVGCRAQEGSVDVFASESFVTGTVRVTFIERG